MFAIQFPMLLIKYASMQPLTYFVLLATAFYLVLLLKAMKFIAARLSRRIKTI